MSLALPIVLVVVFGAWGCHCLGTLIRFVAFMAALLLVIAGLWIAPLSDDAKDLLLLGTIGLYLMVGKCYELSARRKVQQRLQELPHRGHR